MNIQLTDNEIKFLFELLCVGRMIIGRGYMGSYAYNCIIEVEEKIINLIKEDIDLSNIIEIKEDNTYDNNEDFKDYISDKYLEVAYENGIIDLVIMSLIRNEIQDILDAGGAIDDPEKITLQLRKKYLDEIYRERCANLKYIELVKPAIKKADNRKIKKER
jgi:hypothetical protein